MSDNNVTIYSASWCKPCQILITFFKKAGIKYTEKDIDAEENKQEKDVSSLPLTVIDGIEIRGYDPIRIARLLGIKFDLKKLSKDEKLFAFGTSASNLQQELRDKKCSTAGTLKDAEAGFALLCSDKTAPRLPGRIKETCEGAAELIEQARVSQCPVAESEPKNQE